MLLAKNDSLAEQFGRFSVAGVLNSVIGYAVIFMLMYLGLSAYLSNLIGYLVGLACSFFLSRSFVFKAQGKAQSQSIKFVLIFLVGYAANFASLLAALRLGVGHVPAQLISGATYFIIMFFFSKLWVFKN